MSTTKRSSYQKESYFVRATPESMNGAQYVAVNKDGSVLYGLRVRIEVSVVEQPEQPPEVVTRVLSKTICKYHVASGNSATFELDDDVDALQLTRILEFYTISNDILVLLSYEPEVLQFTQTVVHLEKRKKWAQTVAVRKLTVSRVTGPTLVSLCSLDTGRVLLCGARRTLEGHTERLTLCIAADPMNSSRLQDEDLSQLIEDFNKFLTSRPPDDNAQSLTSIVLLNIDHSRISILLAEVGTADPENEPLFSTNFVGIIDRKNNRFLVEKMDDKAILTGEPIKITSVGNLKVRNGSVWMSFSSVDIQQLNTLYWRLKFLYVRIMLKLMVIGFQGCMFLRRYDNGFSFHWLVRILMFLNGPTMIPMFAPQKKFYLCHLDVVRRRFARFQHSARALKSKWDHNATDFAVNFDVDSSGGALVVDYPPDELKETDTQMALSYYPNPTKPKSLAKLSMYSAYRYFPSFEKSSLLRRLTGLVDWKWTV